jgi:hypothetical protein
VLGLPEFQRVQAELKIAELGWFHCRTGPLFLKISAQLPCKLPDLVREPTHQPPVAALDRPPSYTLWQSRDRIF